jgi:hypothetical protein
LNAQKNALPHQSGGVCWFLGKLSLHQINEIH